jgi:hypothetical protein
LKNKIFLQGGISMHLFKKNNAKSFSEQAVEETKYYIGSSKNANTKNRTYLYDVFERKTQQDKFGFESTFFLK